MGFTAPKEELIESSGFTAPDDELLDSAPEQSGSFIDKIADMGKGVGPAIGGAIGRSTGLGMAGEVAGRYFGANPEDLPKAAPLAMMVAMPEVAGAAGVAARLAPATNALFRMSAGAVGGAGGEGLKRTGEAILGKKSKGNPIDAIAEMGKSGALSEAAALGAGPIIEKGVEVGAKAGKIAAKGYGKLAEFFSGVPASDIVRLADDPAAILPEVAGGSLSTNKAGKAFGSSVKEAGFLPEAAATGEGLGKFAGRKSPFKASEVLANESFERVASGETLTPPEMYEAYKAAQESVSKMSRKNPRYVEMLDFKDALQDTLKSLSGEYAGASADFARAAVGRSTSNILPRTRAGNVSLGRAGFSALVASKFGIPLSSPALYGATTAATAGLSKAAEKAASNPITRRIGLSEIIRRAKENQ